MLYIFLTNALRTVAQNVSHILTVLSRNIVVNTGTPTITMSADEAALEKHVTRLRTAPRKNIVLQVKYVGNFRVPIRLTVTAEVIMNVASLSNAVLSVARYVHQILIALRRRIVVHEIMSLLQVVSGRNATTIVTAVVLKSTVILILRNVKNLLLPWLAG